MNQEFTFHNLFGRMTRRIVAATTVFFFTFSFYSPAVHAAYQVMTQDHTPAKNTLEHFNPLGFELQQLQKIVAAMQAQLRQPEPDIDALQKALKRIEDHRTTLVEADQQQRASLALEQQQLTLKQLPDTVLARQQSFEQTYTRHMDAILQLTAQLQAWTLKQQDLYSLNPVLSALASHLQYPVSAPKQSFGSDLDFIEPATRSIYTTPTQIRNLLGVSADSSWSDDAWLQTDAATASTDRIQNLISEVGTDPVDLYNWVHDHLRYIPSYGIMQGADYTLQTEQGNAFDIASTLIALYRAAGIPARYQYGIVALTPAQVQNWVGGVVNVNAAVNLLSQGGIPQQQYSYGGAIEEIELEHVWVQAYVDDQWISVDPSFKQYEYTDGMDIQSAVPLDTTTLMEALQASGTRNDDEGWIQGMDPTIIQNALTDYQSQLQDYFSNQQPNATLGDVLGQQTIIASEAVTTDDISLPYSRVVASAVVPNLPETLYHQFTLQIGNTIGGTFGLPIEWYKTVAELSDLTPNLVGHDLAISFKPATDADEQTLLSYLPDTIETVDDLPTSIPANTVHMVGEITKDGETIAQTGEVTLGQSLMTRLGYTKPQGSWNYSENNLDVGVYQAVGLDMQGISPAQLEALQTKLEQTETIFKNADEAGFNTLTNHDLIGNTLQIGIQGYLAETYTKDKLAARSSKIVTYRSPSYGTFSTALEVAYYFGTPRKVNFTGVLMDVDRLQTNSESKNNCYDDWLKFNKTSGMRSSAYEHLIPERLFTAQNNPVEGISTAKAFTLAMMQGQKIYALNAANADQLANIVIDDAARSEISQALSLGLEVTVHEKPITINGWKGSGYSIINPDYGIGAYKISGAASGGFLVLLGFIAIAVIAVAPIIIGGWSLMAGLGALLAIKQAIDFADKVKNEYDPADTTDLSGDVFLLVLEAMVVTFMSLWAEAASGFDGEIRMVWEALITTAIGIFGGLFAEL